MTPKMNASLANFRECIENAPTGTHVQAKQLSEVIGNVCDKLITDVRDIDLKADNCDLIYAVEAAIYDYVKRSNPGNHLFAVSEGFGAAMGTEARERVIAATERDRDVVSGMQNAIS
jgi:hypothetical protein